MLTILPLQHTTDGHITLLINGKEYNYWCDNAKVEQFLNILRRKNSNKGKALSDFKQSAMLLERR